ncbi:MAG: peptidoglycan DD-metalloendopeptidase family protein, partial [Acidobacteriota bacterium]
MRPNKHLVLMICAVVVAGLFSVRYMAGALYKPPAVVQAPKGDDSLSRRITEHLTIGKGDSLDKILGRVGLDANARAEAISALREVFDVRKIRIGRDLLLTKREKTGDLEAIEYQVDSDHKLHLVRQDGVSSAEMVQIPSVSKEIAACGELQGSLSASFERMGENPSLASEMAEIFSFDIDFYRNPRAGDRFCLLFEKKVYENGQAPSYGKILAARYVNGRIPYDAFLFTGADADTRKAARGAYYSSDGKALMAAFLRSPLEFDARISSHFSSSRLHPVLNIARPHFGTDYAAPTGTPVRTVGAGRVSSASYTDSSGNMVTVDHPDGYRTQYLHLSRMLVRPGQHVDQGEH